MEDIQLVKQRFGIIGNSNALNHAIRVAIQVAPTDMTVLITGESGSGKESFSKIIHHQSTRKHNNFIAINCGAIPEGTIASELFGHEKGSFTGATEARKGYFEVTDGGTIFLDEIGEMPLDTQARLLRVLESGEFIRVGSSKVQKTNVRVIAATNVNLIDAVQKGKFREDLYYRLNTVPIYVPPLRERGKDIELLFRKFAADFSEKYHVKAITLEEEAKPILVNYRFQGNVRQLRNIVEQISVLEENRSISAETLRKYLPQQEVSRLPALYGNSESRDNFTERDLLYKILFELKKDVSELKQIIASLIQGGVIPKSASNMIFENDMFSTEKMAFLLDNASSLITNTNSSSSHTPNTTHTTTAKIIQPSSMTEYDKIEDVTPEIHEENESLSLEKLEKEAIVEALKRNHNKRKYAAQELGISERTLYRKIKQYELDNLNF